MKLQKLTLTEASGDLSMKSRGQYFFARTFGQMILRVLNYAESSMSLPLLFARMVAVRFCWILFLALPSAVFSQTNYYGVSGGEYAICGQLPGDQVWPDIAANVNGGFLVWQDNATDGSGWGISARRLDSTLSGTLSAFSVNSIGTNDQENARVALLKNGGAVFVWQGGVEGVNQHIYARFLSPSNTWLTDDVLVSAVVTNTFYNYITNTATTTSIKTNYNIFHQITGYTTNTIATTNVMMTTNVSIAGLQINPAITVLNNSNVVVIWSSFNQAGLNSMKDIYGQVLSPAGQKIGTNFLVNQFISYNQRDPAIAPLPNGGFVTAWVSEQERSVAPNWGNNTEYDLAGSMPTPSVDIYARLYSSNGVPTGGEFLVNSNFFPCARPAMAVNPSGGFMVTWGARDIGNADNSWDIYARSYSGAGAGGIVMRINSHVYGDQYLPQISSIGMDYLVIWTSLAQDGSREGVFGQFLNGNSTFVGNEFLINTTTVNSQMQPAITSDGSAQFLVVWTSFAGLQSGFDLYAQRYISSAQILQPLSAPFISAPFVLSNGVYQPQLAVSWPTIQLQGIPVSSFEVYVDGNSSPTGVTVSNSWTMTAANGLAKNSTHSFAVDYVTTTGRRSPISPSASGSTWSGDNWGGIPVEWMKLYFGNDFSKWPSPTTDSDGDGQSNLQEFMAGTTPTDSNSVLRQQLIQTQQGMFLTWNTQPGLTYQVQVTTNLISWNNFGSPRFAAGTNDLVHVPAGYFRIQLQR